MAPLKPLSHQEALEALRGFLKERSSYDVFPVSFRLIVLDSQLKVKKALDVMLLYGEALPDNRLGLELTTGVVSAPLWNTASATFAGMFTVQDVIHLIQYYYHTSSWEGAAADVEQFRLQSLRGEQASLCYTYDKTSSESFVFRLLRFCRSTHCVPCSMPANASSKRTLDACR